MAYGVIGDSRKGMMMKVWNLDDEVWEEYPDEWFEGEVCDEPANVCATCELRDYCGNAKE